MRLDDIRIAAKLGLGFGFMAILIIAVGLVGFRGLNSIGSGSADVAASMLLTGNLSKAQIEAERFARTNSDDAAEHTMALIREMRQSLSNLAARLKSSDQALLDEASLAIDVFESHFRGLVAQRKEQNTTLKILDEQLARILE
jgi:hypothetical protein